MEAGLKEVAAALLAGLVLGVVLDFVYTNANTAPWFARAIPSAPGTPATGGVPPSAMASSASSGGGFPEPDTL